MPTLSFKDRGAVLLAELALRLSPHQVVADSSGNAGTAIAAYCARARLPCTVYVPDGTSAKKLEQIEAHGARVQVVDGNRDAAGRQRPVRRPTPRAPSTPPTSTTRTSCTARRRTSTSCGRTWAAGSPR